MGFCNGSFWISKRKLFIFTEAKRLIGRKFDDSVVQSDMKYWSFKVINDSTCPEVQVEYKCEYKTFYPEEISSMVLTKMKEIAEAYLGKVCYGIFLKTKLEYLKAVE